MDELEERDKARADQLKRQESLAVERQDALLSTILLLEERVEALESAIAEDLRSVAMSGSGSLLPRDQRTEDWLGSSLSPPVVYCVLRGV